jgi:replication factor C subunit 3/5
MQDNKNVPWVEKYRPTQFENIVLDEKNKKLFQNILDTQYFPNLLFYGPPGTGKTTTIINLINEYNNRYTTHSKGSVIHLNASDERGIEIIRNQIQQFVKTTNFFENCIKFVILDEVDYMTKNAQQALKYLLQINNYKIRFCLICNYISKVDTSLKNEFLCIRFNQLPKDKTIVFLKNIAEKEEVSINNDGYEALLDMYKSDIRSMINFMQLNKDSINLDNVTLSNVIMDDILEKIKHSTNYKNIINLLHDISIQYNYDKKTIIKKLLNYIIRYKTKYINEDFLILCKTVLHENDLETYNMIKFVVLNLNSLIH